LGSEFFLNFIRKFYILDIRKPNTEFVLNLVKEVSEGIVPYLFRSLIVSIVNLGSESS